jgi:hypothetical protein
VEHLEHGNPGDQFYDDGGGEAGLAAGIDDFGGDRSGAGGGGAGERQGRLCDWIDGGGGGAMPAVGSNVSADHPYSETGMGVYHSQYGPSM